MAKKTMKFVSQLRSVIKLPIETVEESVSTIEATAIYKQNRLPRSHYRQRIDSVAAAVILNRVIGLDKDNV
jgi:RNase H-fold protein (predicted Holliday junction resolvase)